MTDQPKPHHPSPASHFWDRNTLEGWGDANESAGLLRGWAKAYRDTPEHRFPSDPNAEFFPVDLERAADLLAAPQPTRDAAEGADPCPYCKKEMHGADDCENCGCGSPARPTRFVTPKPAPDAMREALEPILNFARAIPVNVEDATGVAYAPFAKAMGVAASLTAGQFRRLLSAPVPSPDGAGERKRWFLASQNDGLFIIDAEPRPSNDDAWHDRPDSPTIVLNVTELPEAKAIKIVGVMNELALPSATGTPERAKIQPPSNPIYCNLDAERFCSHIANKCGDCPLYAILPVREDREAIARALFKNRQHLSDEDVDRWFKVYAGNPEGIDHFRMAIRQAYSDADAILSLPAQPGASEREVFAWVIEHGNDPTSKPLYFSSDPSVRWIADPMKAARFCRKIDAFVVSNFLYEGPGCDHRICEHAWIETSCKAPQSRGEA